MLATHGPGVMATIPHGSSTNRESLEGDKRRWPRSRPTRSGPASTDRVERATSDRRQGREEDRWALGLTSRAQ